MKNIFFICLFLSMSLAVSGKKAQVSISCLKTEMLVNPQNIDCPSPRLSWEILSDVRDVRQVSYHILVSTSLEKLNREEGDGIRVMWRPISPHIFRMAAICSIAVPNVIGK